MHKPNSTFQIPPSKSPYKVAIVHDWLYGGGAEKVVEQLHILYPDAPIYTSYCSDEWRQKLDNKVITGYLQKWPFRQLRKLAGPLRVKWFGGLDLTDYDIVISSSGNGEAKDLNVPKTTTHISYCHAPTHYYWRNHDQYLKNPGMGLLNPLARLGLRILLHPMKRRDYAAAQKPDFFIANSHFIADEIKQYYGRDATVIHPPVDLKRFSKIKSKKRHGYITVQRQVPYKHTDQIVAACSKLGVPLTVVGRGPEHDTLVAMAGPTVTFPENVSDETVATLLANSTAFLFAAVEDFGIAPVEALACGTPVIAYGYGGACDYVIPGKTGIRYTEQSTESLMAAMQSFHSEDYDELAIKKFSEQFSAEKFRTAFAAFVTKIMEDS